MKKDHWIIIVFLLTFILSILFSTVSNVIAVSCNNIVLFIVLVLTISFGILFDLIGTAAITGNESTFHALNSKKIKGAKQGLAIVKNSNKISSFCNDIVGDICGIISGSIGAILAISLSTTFSINNTIVSIVLAAFISAFTVGGKAIFKVVAIKNADNIILVVSKFLSIFGGNK
jgi:CBS domain containing-hemolysin-like protein